MRWRRRSTQEDEADTIQVPVITSVPTSPRDVVNVPIDGYFMLPTTWMRLGYAMQATLTEFAVEHPRDAERAATVFARHMAGLGNRVARRAWA